jgi:hypothetical protein
LKRIPEATTKGLFRSLALLLAAQSLISGSRIMRAFSVVDSVYERGYAERGKYEAALPRKVS